ncbi:MAG: alpha/beta hydrolase [Chloroflexota bacterium]
MHPKTIRANHLDFAYYEVGSGEKVIFCFHGFPDTADTWRDLMPVLAEQGYRVIAPFMRGYPPTEIPADKHYSSKHLGEDIIGLLDAFEIQSAIVIGHDWGALASYSAVALAPERFQKLITVAIPHPRALRFDLQTLIKARHFLTFQQRGSSVRWMKRNNYAAISQIFRRWSPNWQFTETDVAPVREAFSQTGATEAALGYYWSFWEQRDNPEIQKLNRAKTAVPTLSLFGDADGAMTMRSLERTASAFTGEYKQVVFPNVGHFLHREIPDRFAEEVLAFLGVQTG